MANTTPQRAADEGADSSLLASLGSLKGGFDSATTAMRPFVAALSPASIGLFDQAMRDLMATVGGALQPVFDAATAVVRDFADALGPIMDQIAPVMQQLAGIVVDTLIPVIDAFASLVTAMLPILRPLMDILRALSIAFQTIVTIISALVNAIIEAIGGAFGDSDGLKSWSEQLVDTVKLLARNLILMVGVIAKWLGAMNFLDNLIKGFDKGQAARKSSQGAAAPTDASITDLKAFGNAVMQRAFTATGGKEKTQEDWLADVVAELQAIKKGNSNWEEALLKVLRKWWAEMGKTVDGFKKGLKDTFLGVPGMSDALGEGWRYLFGE